MMNDNVWQCIQSDILYSVHGLINIDQDINYINQLPCIFQLKRKQIHHCDPYCSNSFQSLIKPKWCMLHFKNVCKNDEKLDILSDTKVFEYPGEKWLVDGHSCACGLIWNSKQTRKRIWTSGITNPWWSSAILFLFSTHVHQKFIFFEKIRIYVTEIPGNVQDKNNGIWDCLSSHLRVNLQFNS